MQTCLWGFARVVALEHPQLWGGLADFSSSDDNEWQQLLSWVRSASDTEDHIGLRGSASYVQRLRRKADSQVSPLLPMRTDATYVITGGLGALGLEAAEYLANRGACNLVLTSRRTPDEKTRNRIDALCERLELPDPDCGG
jgi:hypothetical protein